MNAALSFQLTPDAGPVAADQSGEDVFRILYAGVQMLSPERAIPVPKGGIDRKGERSASSWSA